jgi:hypothetical protein
MSIQVNLYLHFDGMNLFNVLLCDVNSVNPAVCFE